MIELIFSLICAAILIGVCSHTYTKRRKRRATINYFNKLHARSQYHRRKYG